MVSDSGVETPEAAPNGPLPVSPSPSLLFAFRVWLSLGLQSFGGGTATLALIRRAAVETHGWLTADEFTREWALVQIAPGINLLALTILIGRRTGGAKGILVALIGLLLPSVTITILLTAGYAHIEKLAAVQAALRGIIPATVGLGLLTVFQMVFPPLVASRKEGVGSLALSLFLLAGSGLAVVAGHWQVILVLLLAGALSGFAGWRRHKTILPALEPPTP